MTDVARGAGRLVAVPLGALARWRHGRPMHPRGAVFDGILERTGSAPPWEVPWLDATARDAVVVRMSRGAGLPAPLPDVLGLAVRLPGEGGPVDLLLTTTGRGALTRLVPFPRRAAAVVYSSIMGYRSDAGVIRLAALPDGEGVPSDPGPLADTVARDGLRFTLAASRGLGPWRPFARLVLPAAREDCDHDIRFDAVLNPPPGLVPDGPMARFRAPAYATARVQGRGQ
ncbi:phosphodiesterase [Blastococcus sp. CT_GayMR16]|uniref:phosphodiesterase n=1 Tax=Blastococcus sp. CT_GayMR16 TaxID=2559607 RepID=UPI0010738002|nr:phosphodiesterase [Blastococcus sp. CT_GayMR16]TFV86466.1 phosphodiesterase [Blastococcus sp. CT_GayMR16]